MEIYHIQTLSVLKYYNGKCMSGSTNVNASLPETKIKEKQG